MARDHQLGRDADVEVEDGTRIVIVWDETIDTRPAAPLFASVRYLDPSPREADELVIEVSTRRPAVSSATRARRLSRPSRAGHVAA